MSEIKLDPATARSDASLKLEVAVRRQLDATRLTLIGILLGVSLTIGFGIESILGEAKVPFVTTLVSAALALVGLCLLLRSARVRDRLIGFADWTLRQ